MKHFFLTLTIGFVALMLGFVQIVHAKNPSQTTESPAPAQAGLIQYVAGDTDLAALAQKGKVVVFFFATWCPNCVMTLTELSQNWEKVDPSLTLVIADYDTETALKSEYGVTYQDTFVLLDQDGQAQKLWNAGGIAGLNANAGAK